MLSCHLGVEMEMSSYRLFKAIETVEIIKELVEINSNEVCVRATGHKAPGESSVNITVSSYDTTHLQENPQRLG